MGGEGPLARWTASRIDHAMALSGRLQLWYDAAKLIDTLTGLCPKADQEIWKLIKPDQDVILEPTVGGKSGADARVSCRKVNA